MWIELPDDGVALVVEQAGCGNAPWSAACQERGELRRSEAGLRAFSAARFALYEVLKRVGRLDDLNTLQYSSEGRPMLPAGKGFVALSHSATHAAAAFHPTRPVGIDTEGPRAQLAKVASKFVAEHEAHQDLRALWGLKEALYKAAGLPGLHFAKDLLWESSPGPEGPGTAFFPGGQALWGRSDADDQCVVWGLLPEPRHLLTAPFRWVITGSESSGKSTWASDLAHRLNVALVPEGAREWMVPGEDYTADDVRTWGRKQVGLEADLAGNASAVVDTDTVNYDVWLQVRFGENWQPTDAWPTATRDRWVAVLSPLETWEPDPLREAPDLADRLRIASLHAAVAEREAGGERVDWWEVAQTLEGSEIARTANQNRWPLLYLCKAQGCPSESKG